MIISGREITRPMKESADVCIVGSGCGGGASAKILAEAGKKVVLLEEGGYYTSADFDGTEATAYQNMYQRRAGQATEDLSVTVLQGRCVGGSTTVNWMTSLRTPEFTLVDWKRRFGIEGLGPEDLDPYFTRVERYLNVHPEPEENHNANNRIILDGARALGYSTKANGRNSRDCVRSGACGLGCPFDAKLSVALTYLPDAVKSGATVYADCRAEKIESAGRMKRVTGNVLDGRHEQKRTDFTSRGPCRHRLGERDQLARPPAEIRARQLQRRGGKEPHVSPHDRGRRPLRPDHLPFRRDPPVGDVRRVPEQERRQRRVLDRSGARLPRARGAGVSRVREGAPGEDEGISPHGSLDHARQGDRFPRPRQGERPGPRVDKLRAGAERRRVPEAGSRRGGEDPLCGGGKRGDDAPREADGDPRAVGHRAEDSVGIVGKKRDRALQRASARDVQDGNGSQRPPSSIPTARLTTSAGSS